MWQPIKTAPKGRAILAQGYGIYHGLPFPALYDPSPYKPDEPWVNMLTKARVPTHCIRFWCEMNLPDDKDFPNAPLD